MTDYTIVNEFTLPSKGLVYNRQINPQVKLRSMTTAEEMKRLNHSDRAYKLTAEVINDCIVNDIGIHVYDMCIPDYQFLLHKLRIVTYGPEYKSSSKCPFCATDNTPVIDLENDLRIEPFSEELFNKYSEITLPQSKKTIKLRMQSPRILDDITIKAKEIRKNSPEYVGDPAFLVTLENLIDTIDGNKYEDFQLNPFLRNLPMRDTNYILKAAQKLNTSFGIDSLLNTTCSFCGLDYNTSFRITSEFFGPSID